MVKLSLIPSYCKKVIKKQNKIFIARLITNYQPNILSNTLKFNTTANRKMLDEEFKMWPIDPISDLILFTLEIHITNLSYLEDIHLHFIKFLNDNIKELNEIKMLNKTAAILYNNDKYLPNLPDL